MMRDSARGTSRNGTRSGMRPVPLAVGVATTAPRIDVRPPTLSPGASTDGRDATAPAASVSVTETATVRPAATVTVDGAIETCAPSLEPVKLALRR